LPIRALQLCTIEAKAMPFGKRKRLVSKVLPLSPLPGMVDALPKHHYLVAIAELAVALVIISGSFDRAGFHRTIPACSIT
jgi:hypothetical protein